MERNISGESPDRSSHIDRPRILLVDDEDALRRVVTKLLERSGLEVESAATGAEARELAGGADFDAALVDVSLPDVDGVDLGRELRGRCPGTIVVLMSGWPRKDIERRRGEPLPTGALYFEKPFRAHDVLEVLDLELADAVAR